MIPPADLTHSVYTAAGMLCVYPTSVLFSPVQQFNTKAVTT